MNKIVVSLIALILILSCKRNPEKLSISFTSDKIEINDNLKGILKQFMNENPCKNCINQLYIDKIEPYKTVITIQQIPYDLSGSKALTPAPLLFIKVDSSTFFLYSGMEKYFNVKHGNIDTIGIKVGSKYSRWTIVDTKDSIMVNKNGNLPFFPFPSE
jgi:hypothetical protein